MVYFGSMEDDPKHQHRRFFLMTFGALVLTVILMTLGVLYFSDQIAQTEHHAREVRNGGMEYVFWTDIQRVRAGDSILLHFQVRNRRAEHTDLTFPPGEQFTIDILDREGTRVAHLPVASPSKQTTTYAMDPWSQVSFELTWSPGVAGAPRLGAGTYKFLGMLKGFPESAVILPIEIDGR